MFFNLALGAYVLGTITLIVIKHDERTGRYRDLTTHLKDYIRVNEIPPVSPVGFSLTILPERCMLSRVLV